MTAFVASWVPLQVVAFCCAAAVLAEVLQWFLVFRGQKFLTLKANIRKHGAKVEAAKAGSAGAARVNLKKKERALQSWRDDAAKEIAAFKFKGGLILALTMLVVYRVMGKLFADAGVVAQLPFHPPGWMRKVTQRALTDPAPQDCGVLFIFVLCQGSLRILIGKLLGLGIPPEMAEITPAMPTGLSGLLLETPKDK